MTTKRRVRLAVYDDCSEHTCEELRAALPGSEVALTRHQPPRPGGLGRDPTFYSVAEYAEISIVGTGLLRALAPVLVAHIRATRRSVRVVRPDGTSVDLDGQFTVEDVQTIVEQALSSDEPSSGEKS